MEEEQVVEDLIDRAWSLHDRIGDEINNSYCRSCDYVGAETTPLKQRQSLLHIRDSFKELHNMLIFLQRMRSWQEMDRDAAMDRLEESRAMLIEKVTQYNQVTAGRDLGVVEEVHACFGSSIHDRNKKEKKEKERSDGSGLRGLVLCCIKAVLNPWKWRKRVGVAVKLTLVLVTISSSVHYVHTRQHQLQYCRSNSRKALDVFDGRG